MDPNSKYLVGFLILLVLALSLAAIPMFRTNFIYAQLGVETEQPQILVVADVSKIIGTQSTQETSNGNKVTCAGNLNIPETICTGTNENDTIVTSPSGGTIYAQGEMIKFKVY